MFEIEITLFNPDGSTRVKTVKTSSYGLWINRYPVGHEHAGEVRDLKLVVKENGQNIYYACPFFTIKVLEETSHGVV